MNIPFTVSSIQGRGGEDGLKLEHKVESNDIIVVGSDGLFDNLYDHDIITCLKSGLKGTNLEDIEKATKCMANKAE